MRKRTGRVTCRASRPRDDPTPGSPEDAAPPTSYLARTGHQGSGDLDLKPGGWSTPPSPERAEPSALRSALHPQWRGRRGGAPPPAEALSSTPPVYGRRGMQCDVALTSLGRPTYMWGNESEIGDHLAPRRTRYQAMVVNQGLSLSIYLSLSFALPLSPVPSPSPSLPLSLFSV